MSISRKNPTLILLFTMAIVALFSVTTVVAQDGGEETPEPGPFIPTDYEIPVDPNIDTSLVIAQVGDNEITVGEFQARMRFERFFFGRALEAFVQQNGEQILLLDDPTNQFAGTIQNAMQQIGNLPVVGENSFRNLLLEALYLDEVANRGLEITACDTANSWANLLQIVVEDCENPGDAYAQARATFIERASLYTGLNETEIDEIVNSSIAFDLVAESIGSELELSEAVTYNTRHIRVSDEAIAQDVYQRLVDGESFYDLLIEFTEDPNAGGNGGALPPFGPGQTVPEFDAVLFTAEIGELMGPIQTQFGFHILEVLERNPGRHVRQIILAEESQAQIAYDLLAEDGVDFNGLASEYSIDPSAGTTGGDLGFVSQDSTTVAPELVEAIWAADANSFVGPIELNGVFYVLEILEEDPAVEVTSRHILVETEELATELMGRIEAGEDFADLANEFSLDSPGHRGNTLAAVTGQPQQAGPYTLADLQTIEVSLALTLVDMEDQLVDGAILEPIESLRGYYVMIIDEVGTRPVSPEERQARVDQLLLEWQNEQFESDRISQTQLWRYYLVGDPFPSAVNPVLEPLDVFIQAGIDNLAASNEEGLIPNILGILDLPDLTPEPAIEATEEPAVESTPESEMTPEATAESDD